MNTGHEDVLIMMGYLLIRRRIIRRIYNKKLAPYNGIMDFRLWIYYVKGKTFTYMARRINRSPTTARNRINRIERDLRELKRFRVK